MNCKKCNAEIAENAKFCLKCGAKVETEPVCSNCGVKLTAGAKFCLECGTPVKNTAKPVFCAECGAKLEANWKVCPECGTQAGIAPVKRAPPKSTNITEETQTTETDTAEEYIDPEIAEQVEKGKAYFDEGKYGRAIKKYSQVIAADPNNLQALQYRALSYFALDDLQSAKKDLANLIYLCPNTAHLYNYRGAVFQRDGNLALALQDYNTAITLYEEDGDDESIADMQERIEEIETIMDSQ